MKTAKKTPNLKLFQIERPNQFTTISNKLLDDKRLSLAEKGALCTLLSKSGIFYVSIRATAKYLNISENTFKKILKNLKSLGYIETYKEGSQTIYKIKQESKYIVDFKPYLIDKYTAEQLNACYNSAETPTKYKNLIKKYLDALTQDTATYENVLTEIKAVEMPKDIYKKQQEQEQEQQNEIDILEYITGKKER